MRRVHPGRVSERDRRDPGRWHSVQTPRADAGLRSELTGGRAGQTAGVASKLEIIGGPTLITLIHVPGQLYRWKVQNGSAEQHVYVQIADALRPETVDEPLRSSIESKGESVLRRLLERGNVPVRIKITSGGITEVGTDQRAQPVSM